MEVFLTTHFKRNAKRLPVSLRRAVEERVTLFQENPFDSRLKTHKLTGRLKTYWSFSINQRIRILFEFDGKHRAIFHAIGDHAIYDAF